METLVTIANVCKSQSKSERCDSSSGSSKQTRSEPDRNSNGSHKPTRAPPVPGDKDSEHPHTRYTGPSFPALDIHYSYIKTFIWNVSIILTAKTARLHRARATRRDAPTTECSCYIQRNCRHGKRCVDHNGSVLVCRVASLAFRLDAVTLSGTSAKNLINISPSALLSSQISCLIHIGTLLCRFSVVISNPDSSFHIFHSGCVSVCSVELLPQTDTR